MGCFKKINVEQHSAFSTLTYATYNGKNFFPAQTGLLSLGFGFSACVPVVAMLCGGRLTTQNSILCSPLIYYGVSMWVKNMTMFMILSNSVSTLQKNMSLVGHSVSMSTNTYRGLIFFYYVSMSQFMLCLQKLTSWSQFSSGIFRPKA